MAEIFKQDDRAAIRDALLAAHNALVRPLRRKLDGRTRADIRVALDQLVLAAASLGQS